MTHAASSSHSHVPSSLAVFPLDEFYAHAGMPLPHIEQVAGHDVPEPYKSLLVHFNDMTPTLAAHHQSSIYIDVLRRERHGDFYFREVVLRLDRDNSPVEFGANRVCLPRLPQDARDLILEEHLPLGQILHQCRVPHRSFPKCFIRVEADDFIDRAFGLEGRPTLYGRQARILDPHGQPISEIVEILPPLAPTA
jgi:chorismate-pyruvate lyase